jgi:hypothetical protein
LKADLSSFFWTDHKPLIFALNRVSPLTSGSQQRHLAFISEYPSILVFVPGTSNVMADALSRPASSIAATATPVCVAIADRALRQILCPQVQTLCSSTGFQIVTQKVDNLDLIGAVATGTFRQGTSAGRVFDHLHGDAHPGMRATNRLIASRYVWMR